MTDVLDMLQASESEHGPLPDLSTVERCAIETALLENLAELNGDG